MSLLGPSGNPVPGPSTPRTEAVYSKTTGVPGPSTEEPQAPTRVTTAYLVYQTPNGQWLVSEDIGAAIVPVRRPLPDDIISGAENIKAQVIARKTADMAAQATVGTQLAMARQMQSQTATPDEAAILSSLGRR